MTLDIIFQRIKDELGKEVYPLKVIKTMNMYIKLIKLLLWLYKYFYTLLHDV